MKEEEVSSSVRHCSHRRKLLPASQHAPWQLTAHAPGSTHSISFSHLTGRARAAPVFADSTVSVICTRRSSCIELFAGSHRSVYRTSVESVPIKSPLLATVSPQPSVIGWVCSKNQHRMNFAKAGSNLLDVREV
eukprot:COSAG01_NODE_3276_length_6317_cov_44.552428_4_plen_134_part_00